MKCSKCKKSFKATQSIYCSTCGHKFTEKEYESNKKYSVASIISRIINTIDFVQNGNLGNKFIVRLILLLLTLGSGIYLYYINGSKIKILKSNDYEIEYYKEKNEYYLYTNDDSVTLNLYIPGNKDKIYISWYDENNKEITGNEFFSTDTKIVPNTDKNNYYIISSDSNNELILHPYKKGDE